MHKKLILTYSLAAAVLGASLQNAHSKETQPAPVKQQVVTATLQIESAKGVINRIAPALNDHFILEIIPKKNGLDTFELEQRGKKVILRGNTGVSLSSAFNYYLKEYCKCHISWCGDQLKLPSPLPQVVEKISITGLHKQRVYFNYCTLNYTASWWNWDRWEREIDFMAMQGINMPLSVIGLEGVWYHTLLKHGYTDQEARKFLVGPTYFAWQWMTNIQSHGGALPKSWIDKRIKMGRQIIQRQLQLGMTPIQQGFSGCVPSDFKKKFPKADIVLEKSWLGFPGTAQLDPLDPFFKEFGKTFLETEIELFGTSHIYAADPFHEGHPPKPGDEYLTKVGEAIFELMTEVDPQATWAMQAWSIREKIACAVPKGRLLVLDLSGGKSKADDSFWGHNFVKGQLHNFGGRINLHGDIKEMTRNKFAQVAKTTAKSHGMGLFMEAIEQNPAFYESVFDQIWRQEPTDINQWITAYAERRYGAKSEKAIQAWQLMINDGPYKSYTTGTEKSSIIAARPALDPAKSGPNSGFDIPYPPKNLITALELLLSDYDQLKHSDAYMFDLMDITRQVLSNLGQEIHKGSSAAFKNKDKELFSQHKNTFLTMLLDVDRLLATRTEFNFGKWYNDARSWATTPEEKKLFEYNAAMLVTIWGPDPNPGIFDYSWREWAGLIRLYYYQRWNIFYTYLDEKLKAGEGYTDAAKTSYGRQSFRANEIYKKMADWEINWIHSSIDISATPVGDTGAIVHELFKTYGPLFESYYSQEHADYVKEATAKDLENRLGKKVASYKKADFPKDLKAKVPHELTVDISDQINQEGKYAVKLISPKNGLKIHSVALLQNKQEVMRDKHQGDTGNDKNNTYTVEVKEHAFGTQYFLKITLEKTRENHQLACDVWIKNR